MIHILIRFWNRPRNFWKDPQNIRTYLESLTQTETSLNEEQRLHQLYEASVYDTPRRILKYFGDGSTVFGVVCKKHILESNTKLKME